MKKKDSHQSTESDVIKIEMYTPPGRKATRTYNQEILKFQPLGKEIKISPKACITINKPGFKTEFFVETVNVLIGIGKDHTADLIMNTAAWEALKAGESIHITTVKEFSEKYIGRRVRK